MRRDPIHPVQTARSSRSGRCGPASIPTMKRIDRNPTTTGQGRGRHEAHGAASRSAALGPRSATAGRRGRSRERSGARPRWPGRQEPPAAAAAWGAIARAGPRERPRGPPRRVAPIEEVKRPTSPAPDPNGNAAIVDRQQVVSFRSRCAHQVDEPYTTGSAPVNPHTMNLWRIWWSSSAMEPDRTAAGWCGPAAGDQHAGPPPVERACAAYR